MKKTLRKFYNEIPGDYYAEIYNSELGFQRYFHRKRLQTVKSLIGRKNGIILDAGCGSGILCNLIKNRGVTVGIDISKPMVRYANRNFSNCRFCIADVRYLPFRENSLDLILCTEVLEHLPNPKKVLKGFRRRLRKGGQLIISVPNEKGMWKVLWKLWLMWKGRQWKHIREGEAGHIMKFSSRVLEKILNDNGFDIIDYRCIFQTSLIASFFGLERYAERVDVFLERTFLKNTGATLIVKCEKRCLV